MLRTFDEPVKAIAYFLTHQDKLVETPKTKEEIIRLFLDNFPSQRSNLEQYLEKPSFRTTGLPLGEHGKDWIYDDSGRLVSPSTLEKIDLPRL